MSSLIRFEPTARGSQGTSSSLLDILGKRLTAWKIEQDVQAELRLIEAQKTLLLAKQDLVSTECAARQQLLRAVMLTEELAEEQQFRQALRTLPDTEAQERIERAIETERLLLEREQIRQHRLSGATGSLPLPERRKELPPAPQRERPVEVHLTDDQIKTLALRAVTRFGQVTPEEADIQWQRWEEEIAARYPPHIAAELKQAAAEMRGLLR